MNTSTQSKIQMFGAWCNVAYVALIIIGWVIIAGFFPLHKPSASADEIASIFQADYIRIRIGMIFLMFAALAVIPLTSVTSYYLARIEGGAKMLTYMSLLGGAGTMVLTFYPAIWWLVAAYRPSRSAELVYLLNDMSWLQLIGGVSLYYALPFSIALAAFFDTSPTPVFPRWAGFYNVWVIIAIMPDMLLFFFYRGPFAWNGLFGFWIPLAGFASWFFVTGYLLRKAILRDRQDFNQLIV